MISATVKSIQDIMRQDAGVDGDAQRISQMVWMIFLKVFDDKEKEWELENEKYQSSIPEKYRWRNWASNKEGITGDELLDFVGEMFKALKSLNVSKDDDPKGFIVREVFEDAYNYMKSGTLIRQVINKLNEIDFNKSEDKHLFNEVYEKILSDLQSAGNAGEYYTPRAVTQFIVDIINPKLGEKVLDPACGTGGFLVSTLENMKKQITSDADLEKLQNNINGVEKKPLPHLLCTTNMILHGIEVPNIRHDNTLARPLADYGSSDMVDVVVTNPPFGGTEEPGIEMNFPSNFRTRETADLFLVLIMKLLRDEGRCGIVLPDGFLYAEGVATRIKEKLLSEFNLHTIVRLPNGVFNPYAGGRTNILFFEKGKATNEIWFFEHQLPNGYKTYGKTKPIKIEEFDLEKKWWNNRHSNDFKKYAWLVGLDEIKKRKYNLDLCNPFKEMVGRNAKEVFERYQVRKEKLTSSASKIRSAFDEIAKKDKYFTENWCLIREDFYELVLDYQNIKRLKQAILNLAIVGKLVPQDVEDEPASNGLKRIELLKEQAMKNNNTKKEIQPSISEEEMPYKLPNGWSWIRLGDYFYLQTGATPSTKVHEYWDGRIKWLKSGDVNLEEIHDCKGRITEEGLTHSNCKILLPDSVLIALNGQGKTRGSVAMLRIEAACNQSLVSMRSYDKTTLIPEYLYYFLKANYMKIREITGHRQRHGLNMKIIGNMLVAIPPTKEQIRIIERVEQLMTFFNELEKETTMFKEISEVLMDETLRVSFLN